MGADKRIESILKFQNKIEAETCLGFSIGFAKRI